MRSTSGFPSAIGLVAVSIAFLLLAPQPAAAVDISIPDSSDFNTCICWDVPSNNWCSEDGTTMFWRNSCRRYAYATLWWVGVVFLILCVAFCFPPIFCCARLLCNCCGGTRPSFGCCCPTTSHDMLRDAASNSLHEAFITSLPTRRYTHCTVVTTKILTALVFASFLYFTIVVGVRVAETKSATTTVTTDARAVVSSMNAQIATVANAFNYLSVVAPSLVSSSMNAEVASVQGLFTQNYNRTMDTFHDIDTVVTASWGPAAMTTLAVALPAALLGVVSLLMMCSIRGTPISVAAGMMSFLLAYVCVALIGYQVIGQVVTAGCNNFGNTIIPTIVNVLASNSACNQAGVLAACNQTGVNWGAMMCASLAPLCSQYFSCPTDLCTSPQSQLASYTQLTNVNAFTTALNEARLLQEYCVTPNCDVTVSACATSAAVCNEPAHEYSMATLGSASFGNVITTLNQAYLANAQCNLVTTLLTGPVQAHLCNDDALAQRYNTVGANLLGAMLSLCFAVVIVVRGAKRYGNAQWGEMPQYGSGQYTPVVYGTPVERLEPSNYGSAGISDQYATTSPPKAV